MTLLNTSEIYGDIPLCFLSVKELQNIAQEILEAKEILDIYLFEVENTISLKDVIDKKN